MNSPLKTLSEIEKEVDALPDGIILVGDSETNGLDPTKIHCFCFKVYPTGEKFSFRRDECYGPVIQKLLRKAKYLVGHNFIGYDLPKVIRRFIIKDFPIEKIRDSLIMSRMFWFDRPGGHGLASWGEQLGIEKPKIEQDEWDEFSEKLVFRCEEDVEINYRLYEKLRREFKTTEQALKLEHYTQWHLDRMGEFGFYFDLPLADQLYARVCREELEMLEQLQKDFPPKSKKNEPLKVRTKIVKRKFVDEDGKPIKVRNENNRLVNKVEETIEKYTTGKNKIPMDDVWGDFSFVEWELFNPGAPEQIVYHLNAAGWKPIVKTKGHIQAEKKLRDRNVSREEKEKLLKKMEKYKVYGYTVDEENLDTVPDDAPQSIKNIKHYLVVRNRKLRMEEWYGSLGDDQRVHGSILGIGARTHRCAHRNPNMGNVPAIKKKGAINYLGAEYRSVWAAPNPDVIKSGRYKHLYKTDDERVIVGVDAEGIQLRILCHEMDDPTYTEQVLTGDPHSYNMFAAGIDPGFPLDYDKVQQKIIEKFGRPITVEEAINLRLGKKDFFDWSGRDVAKTFIYAFLLGAGNTKIENITGIPGHVLKERFYEEIPALYELQEVVIPAEIKRGYTVGLDGRRFSLDNVPKHKVLSIKLQGGETIVMKTALHFIMQEIKRRNLDAFPVAFVHDEFQIDSAKHCAEEVKLIATSAIKQAGVYLKLKCPMAGDGRIGHNWKETH